MARFERGQYGLLSAVLCNQSYCSRRPHLDELDVVPVEGLVGDEEVVGGREPVPVGVQHFLVDAEKSRREHRAIFFLEFKA